MVGDELRLEREPANRLDPNAVRVLTLEERWLGYLPRAKSAVVATLVDAGLDVASSFLRNRRCGGASGRARACGVLTMARVVYRIPAIRDEEPPKTRDDYIVVERRAPMRRGLVFGSVALAALVAYELPATRVALFALAFAAFALFRIVRNRRAPVRITINSGAKTIAWRDIVVPFSEIAYPLVDRSTKELVLCKKQDDERIVIVDGTVESCGRARDVIARALIAEYASFRDMPEALAALARQLDAARSAKEKDEQLHLQLRALPLDNLELIEESAVILARGKRDGLDVVLRYTRWKQRAEVIVERPVTACGHIELLRGDFSTKRSGLVELTYRIFVNGTQNSVAFSQRTTSSLVLRDMDRLDLRRVCLWPTEVRIVPYSTFLGLWDSDSRFADWIALAVACAKDVDA